MGGAVTGAQAGTNAVQNNYLSEGQKAQRDAEMAACPGAGCRTGTATKWLAIDISQDAVFTAGALSGAAIGLNESIDSIVHTAGNFTETITALKSVVESGGVWDSVKQSYIDRLDKLQMHYEEAGASGSYLAGVETGKLLIDMASVLADGAGLVKGGALLAEKVTAKVAKAELEVAAKGSAGTPPWFSAEGEFSGRLSDGYASGTTTTTFNEVVVENAGDFSGGIGAKGGGSSGFSGGKPTIVDDPYSPNAVTERSSVNRDYYGRETAADEFSAGLPDYATHSTAKSYQSTAPRDLNEQTLWNRVTENPSAGRDTKLAGDKDFPRSEGWRKMEVSHRLPSGENITIHYQYNSVTGKAYDMKITTPQQLPPVLQPGRTIE
ncbi:VENN motif pre-toxin domain-containing protein [Pseudomonas poae]|uniref:VENN motif pre-toxin domain-containing protein n=1 Tax=Pseudomonas poae TaxID=200451 RepID=UPI003BB204ED